MSGRQGFITNGVTYVYQESPTTSSAAFGIDSAGGLDTWKLKALQTDGATPTGTCHMEIDSNTDGNITFTPNGSGRVVSATGITVTTGGITITAGNTTLTPLAAARAGIVKSSTSGVLSALIDSNSDGQVLISSSVADPAWATLTAGSGISITEGHNTISIASTATSMAWSREASDTVAAVADHGYVNTNVGLTTFTLPSSATIGTIIAIVGESAAGWSIAQRANQSIQFGSVATTVGVGGSLSSSQRYDVVYLVCRVADLTWSVTSAVGVLSLV